MKRGFSVPFIAIFVAVFLALPAVFWLVFSESITPGVKGASTKELSTNGFGVSINTKSTSWDLYEFLCAEKEDCLKSLESGQKIQVISGGATDGFSHVYTPSESWSPYKYAKVYVKPAWGSQGSRFYGAKGFANDVEIYDLEKDGVLTSVALIPLDYFRNSYGHAVSFTN